MNRNIRLPHGNTALGSRRGSSDKWAQHIQNRLDLLCGQSAGQNLIQLQATFSTFISYHLKNDTGIVRNGYPGKRIFSNISAYLNPFQQKNFNFAIRFFDLEAGNSAHHGKANGKSGAFDHRYSRRRLDLKTRVSGQTRDLSNYPTRFEKQDCRRLTTCCSHGKGFHPQNGIGLQCQFSTIG